jgi:hypothetical protein
MSRPILHHWHHGTVHPWPLRVGEPLDADHIYQCEHTSKVAVQAEHIATTKGGDGIIRECIYELERCVSQNLYFILFYLLMQRGLVDYFFWPSVLLNRLR